MHFNLFRSTITCHPEAESRLHRLANELNQRVINAGIAVINYPNCSPMAFKLALRRQDELIADHVSFNYTTAGLVAINETTDTKSTSAEVDRYLSAYANVVISTQQANCIGLGAAVLSFYKEIVATSAKTYQGTECQLIALQAYGHFLIQLIDQDQQHATLFYDPWFQQVQYKIPGKENTVQSNEPFIFGPADYRKTIRKMITSLADYHIVHRMHSVNEYDEENGRILPTIARNPYYDLTAQIIHSVSDLAVNDLNHYLCC